jgi:hypothetical protein
MEKDHKGDSHVVNITSSITSRRTASPAPCSLIAPCPRVGLRGSASCSEGVTA